MPSSTQNLVEEKVSHVSGAYKTFVPVDRVALEERIARNCLVLQDWTMTPISKIQASQLLFIIASNIYDQ